MTIRRMEIGDYDRVYALWKSVEGLYIYFGDTKEHIERFLGLETQCSYVAVDGDEIIGVILANHNHRFGFIEHLVVDDTYRRLGIGRKLVESVIESFGEQGMPKSNLLVYRGNDQAISFWKSVGFCGREHAYFMTNYDEGNELRDE